LGETVTIDGRGMTIQEAVQEMWTRMQPLEGKGFHPISEVEIVDASKKEIIQTFELSDPNFQLNLNSGQQEEEKKRREKEKRLEDREHVPERKEHYEYIARIRLEA
jgi:hypothetical protein